MENCHQCNATIQQLMACYNLAGEPDDDPTNIKILELEGTHKVKGSGISSDQFLKPLKNQESEHWLTREPEVCQYRRLLG